MSNIMSTLVNVLIVAGMFMLRIGLPLLVILTVGALIERTYRRRAEAEEAAAVAETEAVQGIAAAEAVEN
jgi:hypothetical protein